MAIPSGTQSFPGQAIYPVIVIGTRAQLIKMAPVLREFESRNVDFRLLFTGQHLVTMKELLEDFGIQTAPTWLGRPREVESIAKMVPWVFASIWKLAVTRRRLLRDPAGQPGLVVVHGDTLSTLLGALCGRLNSCQVIHVESGLRSFNWREPFPEEITRLLVFRLIHVALCPGPWATDNMARYSVKAVDTGANTLLDGVKYAVARKGISRAPHTRSGQCVVSIHRFENLRSTARLKYLVNTIRDIARHYNVHFVLHPATRARLERSGYLEKLQARPEIRLLDRMGYLDFICTVAKADFVLTDGGSNQEELSYLGIPTLIARERSERLEGLLANAELMPLSEAMAWRDRLHSIQHRMQGKNTDLLAQNPSEIVVNCILEIETNPS